MVLIGGVAAGAGVAGVAGIANAAPTSSSTPSASVPGAGTSGATASGRSSTAPSAPAPRGGPGGAKGHRGGPGGAGGGTITRISGSTLTLRTENGTETVDTSSSTTYAKEMQTVSFGSLEVGDVVHVAAAPATSGTSPSVSGSGSSGLSTPAQPGTGTVSAARVTVVEPSLAGRVTSNSNGTFTLVGRDGQLLMVNTTSGTRYYNGTASTTSSAISDGTRVMAEGSQTGIASLNADVITVAPTPPTPGRAPGSVTPPSSSTGSSTGSSTSPSLTSS